MIQVSVNNQQTALSIDSERLRHAVRTVLESEKVSAANVTVAVVGNERIWELNRRFLKHDFPTDVLTFPLGNDPDFLEGDIVVSADFAIETASEYGWGPHDELLLYVVHGALHLVDYDDKTPAAQHAMRAAEKRYLRLLGVEVPSKPGPE